MVIGKPNAGLVMGIDMWRNAPFVPFWVDDGGCRWGGGIPFSCGGIEQVEDQDLNDISAGVGDVGRDYLGRRRASDKPFCGWMVMRKWRGR